jgi:hypothetical protein
MTASRDDSTRIEPTGRTGTETLPAVEPGVTLLRTTHARSSALHRLALETVRQVDGGVYWVDARNTASTYALHDVADHRRRLRRIRIARAFTAHQHVSLVERVVNAASPRTGCVILPNAASLYRDDDVPAYEAVPLCEGAIAALAEVSATYDVPVLVTDAGPDDDLAELLAAAADATYRTEPTDLGYRFVGEEFETTVYWDATGWQTTIPYWVELCGAVREADDLDQPGPAPMMPATLGGV